MTWRATTKSLELRERMEISVFQYPVTSTSPTPAPGEDVELQLANGDRVPFTIARHDDFELEIAVAGTDRWILRSTSSRTLERPPRMFKDSSATHWIVVQHIGA